MGAEESRMYPGQSGGSSSTLAQPGGTRTNYATQRPKQPSRIPPPILPQPVLLVGYTPDGAPILMSNTTQNSVSQLAPTMTTTQVPFYDPQSTVAPTLTTGSTAAALPTETTQMSAEVMTNLFNTQNPVMAVPTTILGPDGKPYTALVKPTSQQEIGAQVIERGITSTGGTYELIREPNGRIVRHVFHQQGHTATNGAQKTARNVTSSNLLATNYGVHSTSTSHYSATNTRGSSTSTGGSAGRTHTHVNTVSRSSTTDSKPLSSTLRSSYSSTTKPAPSPPHPTVQSTADFLRQNSSLDTSYCPPSSSESESSKPQLMNYVTWDSDIAKAPSKDEKSETKMSSSTEPSKTSAPSIYPSLDNQTQTNVPTQEVSTRHTPSKALKSHYSHGGDKGLIDVENPYEDL